MDKELCEVTEAICQVKKDIHSLEGEAVCYAYDDNEPIHSITMVNAAQQTNISAHVNER